MWNDRCGFWGPGGQLLAIWLIAAPFPRSSIGVPLRYPQYSQLSSV